MCVACCFFELKYHLVWRPLRDKWEVRHAADTSLDWVQAGGEGEEVRASPKKPSCRASPSSGFILHPSFYSSPTKGPRRGSVPTSPATAAVAKVEGAITQLLVLGVAALPPALQLIRG